MVKLQDISLFFKSKCCYTELNNKQSYPLVETLPEKIEPLLFFRHMENILGYQSESLHVATITIGNQYYGKLSAEHQYIHFIKAIRECYPYRGNTKYLFYFEFTSIGQLHAHGIIYNGYRSRFIDYFNKFGSRNIHKDSYQPLRNKGYLEMYIHKDKNKMINYPPIHNIMRKDINTLVKSVSVKGEEDDISVAE